MKIDPANLAKPNTEHAHQVALFCWAGNERETYPELQWMFAIPNGGERNKAVAAQLVAEGARAGVPDVMLPIKRHGYAGLFIEMKLLKYETRAKGGRSDEQVRWHNGLALQGYAVLTCYSWEHARDTITSYLAGPK